MCIWDGSGGGWQNGAGLFTQLYTHELCMYNYTYTHNMYATMHVPMHAQSHDTSCMHALANPPGTHACKRKHKRTQTHVHVHACSH